MTDGEQIDLAKVEGFVLGALRISPPTLEVASGDKRETLEPRIMQVFVALARRRGEVVSRDELITQCWDGRSVGDDAINRCIARLRRLAEAEGGFAIETIPRVGYRLKETATAPAEPVLPPQPPAKLAPAWWRSWWALAVAVALIVAVTSANLWLSRPAPLNRVAVLPLQPLGPGDDARVFGTAVADQIVSVLNENQVQAVAQGEIANLRGAGRDDAAQSLGADFILDGTVQHTPQGLRVIVHLDRASSHTTLWTGTFEQSGIDPTSLQSQVAARVVDEIKAALAAAGLKDDAAVAAFLKAKEYAREGGRTAAVLRHDQMRIVVAHAPDFSLGHSGLAWSAASLLQYSSPAENPALRAEAQREATLARERNPANGEVYLALAALAPPRDYGEQERLFRKGLAVEPDEPTLNSSLAFLLEDVGRISEALPLHERAVMLDPLSPRKAAGYAAALIQSGNFALARTTIERAVKMWPTNPSVWSVRFYLETFGDIDEARAVLQQGQSLTTLEPDFFAAVEVALTGFDHNTPQTRTAARQAVLAAVAKHHLNDHAALELLARLGEVDAAYSLVDHAYFADQPEDRYARPDAAVLLRPVTAALRRDPRFLPLVERLGLVAYWKNHTAPDFCRAETVAPCPDLKPSANRPR